ncbi:MAG TPA: 4a-hydroxytetrahydrobiopterin dehydratase [Thermoanaerobaculia bacterium]|nr:4a-hydroxytetrahydrobiopterin dehydratase [Thermoanaerobaculia bacterium]
MSPSGLAAKECIPCKGGVPPLTGEELARLLAELGPNGWRVVDGHHLEKEYEFPDFVSALAFVNRVGELAEEQGHHPDLYLAWGRVRITIWTHKIDGLTESDFVLAAKADQRLAG